MSKAIRILRSLLFFMLIAVITGCAPARKNPVIKKRQQASKVHTSQLGRNRYYFSNGYQKKLIKSYKKRRSY
ncbi:MAG: hypothetical protein JXN62_03135 [Bacteroidales bacterium]|nr:hypothetical protein [Bacteroidales bacterium]